MSPVRRIVSFVGVVCLWTSSIVAAQPAREVGAVGRGPVSGGVAGRRPVADAGRDRTVAVGALVQLDGAGSTDADGDRLLYRWMLVRRPATSQASLAGATTLTPTFVTDAPGRYVARLAVSDRRFVSDADDVVIDTRNSAPHADAGPARTVALGASGELSAAGSVDVDGDRLTYAWHLVSSPRGSTAALTETRGVTTSLTPDRPGRYVARVIVHDGQSSSEPAEVTIDTRNTAPVSRADAPGSANVGDTVTLDAAGSTDIDGDRVSYRWALLVRPAGSTATVSDPAAVRPTVTIDKPGAYVAQVIVSDGTSESVPSTTVVTTANAAPVARVAPGASAPVGQVTILDASASSDADGDALSYRWALVSRPPASRAVISDPAAVMPNLIVDAPGVYVAQLVVNDGLADSRPVTTALVSPMAPPVAIAAVASIVGRTVTLDGSGSFDPENSPLAFTWSLISVPSGSTAALSSSSAVSPTFVMDLVGTYVAQLIVNDGVDDSAPATAAATLFPVLLVANAGPDQFLGAVNVNVQLNGSGTATTQTYAWSFVSTPGGSGATLSNPAIAAPTFTADVAGDYVLQLVVSDGVFTSAPDTVRISTDRAGLRFVPSRLTLAAGGAGTLTLALPSTFAGNTLTPVIALTSSDPAAASVPAEVLVPPGQQSVTIPVTGGTTGAAIITASLTGVEPARAVVGVGVNVVEWAVDANGDWGTAANWSGGSVPAAGDVVLIDRPAGNYTITVAQPTNAIRMLLAYDGVTVISTLLVTGDAVFAGGVTIAAAVTAGGRVTFAAPATWTGGVLTGGQIDVLPGQTFTLTTTVQKVLASGTLTNNGTVTWQDGTLILQGSSVVVNAAGGSWDVQTDLTITSSSCGQPTFTNAGTLRKSGGTGAFSWASCVLATNTGTLEIASGSMQVLSGLTTNGAAVLATGTSFPLDRVTLNPGATFGGAGTLQLNGTTTVNGDIVFALPTTMTGTAAGSGKIVVGAPFTWSGGTFLVTGGLDVPSGQTLILATTTQKVLSAVPWLNQGIVSWSSGTLLLQGNAAVTNAAGAIWDVQGDLAITSSSCGQPTFTNAGTLRKTAGGGAFSFSSCVAATNTGTIEVLSGSAAVGSSLASTGLISLGPSTTFSLTNVTLNAGATFGGSGTLLLDGTTTVNGDVTFSLVTSQIGTVLGTGRVIVGASFTWDSGTILLAGGVLVPAGQTLHVQTSTQKVLAGVPLSNQGTVSWSNGTLLLQGNAAVTNAVGALWDVRGDLAITSSSCGQPTFVNAGTVRKSVGPGAFVVASCVGFSSTGTIDIQNGTLTVASTLNSSGVVTVAFGSTVSLNNVTLGAGTTFTGNGTLTLDGVTTVNTAVTFSLATILTGTVNGTGQIVVGAPFTWTSGTLALTGGLLVPGGQTLTMSSGSSKVFAAVPFVNQGTVAWTGGTLLLQSNTPVTNAVGALWDVQGDLAITSSSCGQPTFVNAGTVRKSVGPGAFVVASCVVFSSTGTIDIQNGTMTVASTLNNSGVVTVAFGSTVSLNNVTLGPGTTFTGSGTLTLDGVTTVNTAVTFGLATILTGTVNGSGQIVVGAPFTWTSGTLALAGGLLVPGGQTLTMSSGSSKVFAAVPFVNQGTVAWTGGTLLLQSNTPVTNAVGALWDVQGDLAITSSSCGTPTFVNAGTLRRSSGSGTFTIASCVAVTNTGTLELQTGGLSVSSSLVSSGLMIGTLAIQSISLNNVTLQGGATFGGNATWVMNGTTTVTGTVTMTRSLILNNGSVTGSGTLLVDAAMQWGDGTVALAGGLEIGVGRTLIVTGSTHVLQGVPFTNRGTVNWTGGDFLLQGNASVTNASGATWILQGAHSMTSSSCGSPAFSNAGLMRMSGVAGTMTVASCVSFANTGTVQLRLGGLLTSQYDRIVAPGVTLGGILDVTTMSGFTPAVGDSFSVLTYSGRTGTFATITGNGNTYAPTYGATALTLQTQ